MRSFLFSSGRVGQETAIFCHPGIPLLLCCSQRLKSCAIESFLILLTLQNTSNQGKICTWRQWESGNVLLCLCLCISKEKNLSVEI